MYLRHPYQAGEEGDGTSGSSGTPPAQPDYSAELAARDERIARTEGRLNDALATLDALGRQGQQQQPSVYGPQPGGRGQIPPHIRQQILASGMSEADLEVNAPLIVPILQSYLGIAAQEVLSMVQDLRDENTLLRMPRMHEKRSDGTRAKKYEHFDDIEDDVLALRDEARKQGRYLDPDMAYNIAVARNHTRLSTQPAATTRSQDASASSNLRTIRQSTPIEEKPVRSASDLAGMSRAERAKFFEANADVPVVSQR